MVDRLDRAARSRNMSKIRGKNTGPELTVRRALHAAGLRYRLHAKELPGRPDIVFRRQKVAVFVHGCFWHRHEGCRLAYVPKSNLDFWSQKFAANIERDQLAIKRLHAAGWQCVVIWECEVHSPATLQNAVIVVAKALGR